MTYWLSQRMCSGSSARCAVARKQLQHGHQLALVVGAVRPAAGLPAVLIHVPGPACGAGISQCGTISGSNNRHGSILSWDGGARIPPPPAMPNRATIAADSCLIARRRPPTLDPSAAAHWTEGVDGLSIGAARRGRWVLPRSFNQAGHVHEHQHHNAVAEGARRTGRYAAGGGTRPRASGRRLGCHSDFSTVFRPVVAQLRHCLGVAAKIQRHGSGPEPGPDHQHPGRAARLLRPVGGGRAR